MSTANSTSLRRTLTALALIGVLAFLSGFLQHRHRWQRGGLLLTGVSTTLLFMAYVGYEWFRLNGDHQTASSIEGFMYLLVLSFGVGTMGSLGTVRGANA